MMTKEEKRQRLIDLLTYGITEYTNNTGIVYSAELADYLLDNAVDIHPMKEGDKCWKIQFCDAPDTEDTYCFFENCCDECKFRSPHVVEIQYDPYAHDYEFGNVIFATKEEAEKALETIR